MKEKGPKKLGVILGLAICINLCLMAILFSTITNQSGIKADVVEDIGKAPVSDTSPGDTQSMSVPSTDYPYGDVVVEGAKYTYMWRSLKDGTSTKPGEKDYTKDEAIDVMLDWLNKLYGFEYNGEKIIVAYKTATESTMYDVDNYSLIVEELEQSDNKEEFYYECGINSVTGELVHLAKYIKGLDNVELYSKYNYLEDDAAYTGINQYKIEENLPEFKELALKYLDSYGIYDSSKVSYVTYDHNSYNTVSYDILLETDKKEEILIRINEKTKKLLEYHVSSKQL